MSAEDRSIGNKLGMFVDISKGQQIMADCSIMAFTIQEK